jgi:hypothetical protein
MGRESNLELAVFVLILGALSQKRAREATVE